MANIKEKQKEVKISSINIKVGGKELSLSLAEAKELKNILGELFPDEKVVEKNNNYWYPAAPYVAPFVINTPTWKPLDWEVTWCDTTNQITCTSNSNLNIS